MGARPQECTVRACLPTSPTSPTDSLYAPALVPATHAETPDVHLANIVPVSRSPLRDTACVSLRPHPSLSQAARALQGHTSSILRDFGIATLRRREGEGPGPAAAPTEERWQPHSVGSRGLEVERARTARAVARSLRRLRGETGQVADDVSAEAPSDAGAAALEELGEDMTAVAADIERLVAMQ